MLDDDPLAGSYGPVLKRGNIKFVPSVELREPIDKGKQVQSVYESIVGITNTQSRDLVVRPAQPADHDPDDDDDIVFIDAVTREPETRPRKRARARATHELVSQPGTPPVQLPPNYGVNQRNKGWQMLERAGWQEGTALGVPRSITALQLHASSSSSSSARVQTPPPPPTELPKDDRLLVPLKASDKFDKKGLGLSKETRKQRKEREARQQSASTSEAVSAKALRKKHNRDVAYRKAMLAYMNRD